MQPENKNCCDNYNFYLKCMKVEQCFNLIKYASIKKRKYKYNNIT